MASNPRIAYSIPTWSSARLIETISSLPKGARLEVISTRQLCWPVAKAWNYASQLLLCEEGYDVVVILNDDVVLRADTGRLLADALLERQYQSNLGVELLMVTADNVRSVNGEEFGPEVRGRLADRRPAFRVGGPDYSCFAIGRRYLEEIGPFDERFVPAYFEDNDSHRRLRLAGFEAAAYAPYFHYGSTTLKTDAERQREIALRFPECSAYYERKWGGPIGKERYTVPFNGAPA